MKSNRNTFKNNNLIATLGLYLPEWGNLDLLKHLHLDVAL